MAIGRRMAAVTPSHTSTESPQQEITSGSTQPQERDRAITDQYATLEQALWVFSITPMCRITMSIFGR